MPPLTTVAEIGSYGERVAAAFVRRHGYRLLTRNCKTERGEIDLVCREGEVLVFVEVRARSGDAFGRPAESIDTRKEEALRAAAQDYLQLLKRDDITWRFDAVEVRLKVGEVPSCTLLQNIFA
ncbi:MAG TPA: YraN family protein [Candidatus Methylacidiphilales bacterium]|jgi:putative endonuclease|nr:YraN family protein [Candidatus Methylacidiphilales bacterium]